MMGKCDGGVALDPGAKYLASAANRAQTAKNVYFSTESRITTDIELTISSDIDVLGRCTVSDPSHTQWLNGFGQAGVFSFTPTGNFGIAANNGILALAGPGSSSCS